MNKSVCSCGSRLRFAIRRYTHADICVHANFSDARVMAPLQPRRLLSKFPGENTSMGQFQIAFGFRWSFYHRRQEWSSVHRIMHPDLWYVLAQEAVLPIEGWFHARAILLTLVAHGLRHGHIHIYIYLLFPFFSQTQSLSSLQHNCVLSHRGLI